VEVASADGDVEVVGERGEGEQDPFELVPPHLAGGVDGAGGDEEGGGQAELLEDGQGEQGVVGVAVVEGDGDRSGRQGLGAEGVDEVAEGEHGAAAVDEGLHVLAEVGGAHGGVPDRHRGVDDLVVHEDGPAPAHDGARRLAGELGGAEVGEGPPGHVRRAEALGEHRREASWGWVIAR
jgi:hypothetical protein